MNSNGEYSGTSIRDLNAIVDNTLEIHGKEKFLLRMAPFLDRTEATIRGYMAPEMFFADVLAHLANKRMEIGDQSAWWLIKGCQDCFFSGLTRVCTCCGEMEGFHMHFTGLCRDRLGVFCAPVTCQAHLSRNSEDVYPQQCRRKAIDGTEFCKEHQA